ncbi:MAG: sensor histidine kinase [Myxococcota bacterium]
MSVGQIESEVVIGTPGAQARTDVSGWRTPPRDAASREAAFVQRVAALAPALASRSAEAWSDAVDDALETLTLGLDAESAAFYTAAAPCSESLTSPSSFARTRASHRQARPFHPCARGNRKLPAQFDLDRLPEQRQAILSGHAQRVFVPDVGLSLAGMDALLVVPCLGSTGLYGFFLVRSGWATRRGSDLVLASASLLGSVMASFLERHRLQAELAARRDRLERADRLATLGQVASSVAHDFNNVLTVIDGNAELLEMILPADAKGLTEVQEISEAAQHASQMVEEMLSFARPKEMETERVSLAKLIHGLERMTKRVAGNGIDVDIDISPDLPCIDLNPGRFERLLLNLASNARDAQPENRPRPGRFALSAERLRVDSTSAGVPNGEYVCLRVEDDGCGMDASIRDKVFEPFFTTKPEGQGTGLGLATCAEVMREVGGAALIESVPGEGTAFELFFPVAASE